MPAGKLKIHIVVCLFVLTKAAAFAQTDSIPVPPRDTLLPAAEEIPKKIKIKTGAALQGTASFYANKFHGRKTATGEIFDQKKFTAACNRLPLGTWIQVTNLRNDKIIVVRINDRLHHRSSRLIDLTFLGAQKLGFVSRGLTSVKIEVLDQALYKFKRQKL